VDKKLTEMDIKRMDNSSKPAITISYSPKCGSSWGGSWSQYLLLKSTLVDEFPGITTIKDDMNSTSGSFDVFTLPTNIQAESKITNINPPNTTPVYLWSKAKKGRYPLPDEVIGQLIQMGYHSRRKKGTKNWWSCGDNLLNYEGVVWNAPAKSTPEINSTITLDDHPTIAIIHQGPFANKYPISERRFQLDWIFRINC